MGEDVAVFVIPGSWECSDKGIWDFVLAKECFARSITMNMEMSFEDLTTSVCTEFELEGMNLQPKLSYWLPSQLSVFSVNTRPLVILSTKMGLRNFLIVKITSPHLNLFLSLEPFLFESANRRFCAAAADRLQLMNNETGNFGSNRVIQSETYANPSEGGSSRGVAVRKNLFGNCEEDKYEGLQLAAEDSNMGRVYVETDFTKAGSISEYGRTNSLPYADKGKGIEFDDDEVDITGIYTETEFPSVSRRRHDKADSNEDQGLNNTDGSIRMYTLESVETYLTVVNKRLEACTEAPALKEKAILDGAGSSRMCTVERAETYIRNENEGNDGQVGEDIAELWPDTNISGIISLVDAATPSLSNNSNDNMELDEAEDKDIDVWTAEAELAVRVIEKGKGKADAATVYVNDDLLDESADSFTDGLLGNYSEDDVYDYQGWTDFIDREYPRDNVPKEIGNGEHSSGVTGNNATYQVERSDSGKTLSKETTDISEEVLDYNKNYSQLPLSLQNIYEDIVSQGTLPTNDSEPVFDNVYNLTNINGCAATSAEEDSIYIGRVFKDKVELQTTLAVYGIKRLFHFKQTRSDKTRLIFVCVDQSCPWRVYAHSASKHSGNFEIRTATLTHTCTITSRAQYGKQASAKVIASVLKGKFANGAPGPRPVDIPDIVLSELKVSVSYMKAWHAKEEALMKSRGNDEASFKLVAVYMHLLEQGNPGTIYKIKHKHNPTGKKEFKYLFFALGACIEGSRFMRRVIVVDGTTIKTKFKGVLLTARCKFSSFPNCLWNS